MNRVQVIIPVREGGDYSVTIQSLGKALDTQTRFNTWVQLDIWENANRCRNEGFARAGKDSEFVLFSDDDIDWRPCSIARLVATLDANPQAAYAFGAYEMGGRIYCDHQFDPRNGAVAMVRVLHCDSSHLLAILCAPRTVMRRICFCRFNGML